MKINYLRNFVEDGRLSMNEYANDLAEYQKKNFKEAEVSEYTPRINILLNFLPNNWKLRLARYINYPLLIKKLSDYDITHVLDHSYAHLVKNIKSKVKILTVHDLIPLLYENKEIRDIYNLDGKRSKKKKYLFRYSAKHFKYFDRIIAVSQNTKKDILKLTDCPESKITVIHTNIPKEYFNMNIIDKEKICNKYQIPIKSKKILISGNGFYKNHITSIKVLENLLNKNLDACLVWIGGHKVDITKIKNSKVLKKIFKIPKVDKKELPAIYKICDVALVPSLYEGMGLVSLEAMRTGIPVVTSNTASIPEIVGKEGLTCDPTDDTQITKNIINLLTDKKFYQKKINDGLIRSKLFDYDKMHKNIINIYKEELLKKYQNQII